MKSPHQSKQTNKLYYAMLLLLIMGMSVGEGWGQTVIYSHDFGTTTITEHPYLVSPNTFNTNLSNSSWSNSNNAWTSYSGSSGQAIALNNSGGTPIITLTFYVASGYQVEINSFSFWRQRSSTGAQNWTMTINNTSVGSGTVPISGANTGSTNVANSVIGLSGIVTVEISLSGASGSGTFRIDDFELKGTVSSTTPTPTISTSPSTLSGFTYEVGSGPSAEQSFTVSGQNLTEAITITPPNNYEISTGTGGGFVATNPITLSQSGGNVAATTIYVRLKSERIVGSYAGEIITVASTGAESKTVTVSGSVTEPVLRFRTKTSGNWFSSSTWESSTDGITWDDASLVPNSSNGEILVSPGHTATIDQSISINQLSIQGTLIIQGNPVTVTVENGEGFDIVIANGGTIRFSVGGSSGGWSFSSGATWKIENGGTYTHNSTRAISTPLNVLTLDEGSTFIYLGSSTLNPSSSFSGRTYYNLHFESETGMWNPNFGSGSGALSVNGTFKVDHNVSLTMGSFTGSLNFIGDIVIFGNFEPNNLSIVSGKACIIHPSGKVAISGTLTNSAGASGLVIKSDATGTGSLIHSTGGVEATLERHIPSSSTWGEDPSFTGWHLVSSPVVNQAISGEWTPGTGYDFYAWSEPTAEWLNQKQGDNNINTFIPGQGYLVANQSTPNKVFTGAINTADQSVSLTNTPANNTFPGWNLVGNPFAAAINTASLSLPPSSEVSSLQIWNGAGASYNPPTDGFIPAMNGFMVHANSNSTLNIPASARVHSSTNFYKEAEREQIVLVARDLTHSTFQKCIVRFHAEATEGFDPQYDAYFLQGFAPQFFSVAGENRLVMNTMPQLSNDLVIGMGFVKNPGQDFQVELSESIPNTPLFLFDRKLHLEHQLTSDSPYAFTAEEGDDPMRFELRFRSIGSTTDVASPEAEEQARVFTSGKMLHVQFSQADAGRRIEVFDLSGRLLMRQRMGDALQHSLPLNLQTGIYLVRIVGQQLNQTERIFVR